MDVWSSGIIYGERSVSSCSFIYEANFAVVFNWTGKRRNSLEIGDSHRNRWQHQYGIGSFRRSSISIDALLVSRFAP